MSEMQLTHYGDREEIRELANRIVRMLPQVKNLGPDGALALAQIAHSMDLNPFTGEVWAIPQRGGSFTIMTGIKGLRRAAKRQAQEMGAIYPFYQTKFRMLEEWEKLVSNLNDGDKGLACDIEIILPADHPYYQIHDHQRFIVSGIGIVRKGTNSQMEIGQLVMKRAEADALKRAFDLPFGSPNNGDDFVEAEPGPDWNDVPIDAQYDEPEPEPMPTNGNGHSSDVVAGTSPQIVVDAGLCENVHSARAAIKHSKIVNFSKPPAEVLPWFKQYRGFRDAGLETPDAAAKADAAIV